MDELKKRGTDTIEKEKELKERESSLSTKEGLISVKEDELAEQEEKLSSKQEAIDRLKMAVDEKKIEANKIQVKADEDLLKAEKLLKANQTEERRLKTLEEELSKGVPGGPYPPTPATGGVDFMRKQQDLLEKMYNESLTTKDIVARQMKLEEDREKRLKSKDMKENQIGKNFKPPIFKGIDGERPEAHLLRAVDWMEASNIEMSDKDKVKNFRLTLDSHAREWYDDADCKDTWENLKTKFSTYHSTQGKSKRHLHERWKSFKFVAYKTDVEKFIRDVKETAKQLNYDNEAVAEMLKSCMPNDMYTNLYKMKELDEIITLIRDIYARKVNPEDTPDPAAPAATGVTPFSVMKGVGGSEQYMVFNNGQVKPFKPYVTPRGRGRGGRGRGGRGRGRGVSQDQQQQNFQGKGQFQFRGQWNRSRGRGRGGQKFDKSPNIRKPRVNSRTPNQDNQRCFTCNDIGHWMKDCPQKQNKSNAGNNQANGQNTVPMQKPFPGYNVVYQPQMYPQMTGPQQMPMQPMMTPQPQGPAMMGEISDVMMQMRDFTKEDNPVYMNITEVTSQDPTPLN